MLEMTFGRKRISTDRPAFVMGIVNATPDSFYENSRGDFDLAMKLVEDGADIIDIGGESTRPGFTPVDEQEELDRVIPLIEKLNKNSDVVISIDTTKPAVISEALECGADIINNVLSFDNDDTTLRQIADSAASVILMHHTGEGIDGICSYLNKKAEFCIKAGIERDKLILDPGIGFGKSFEQNVEAIKYTDRLCALGYPVLMALSRKSSIGMMTGRPVEQRLSGTVTADIISILKGAKIIRVHDVLDAIDSLNVMKYFE
ncbi:MAG: dihydropteroate synthase [Treponema sp.]|nr:dihydropteroate synthase [Treponema sp.]